MVTQVQLGNFFTSNGRTVLGGVGGSGLDTKGLLESLTTAKALPATKLQDKITLHGKQATALDEFQKLLDTVRDAANFLRTPPGVGNAADDVFRHTSPVVSSNTSVAASSYISVSSSPGASLQGYTVTDITSIAAAKKQKTNSFSIASADTQIVYASPAANQFGAGTIVVNGSSITLSAGDSLNAVVNKFNAVSDETGISASVLQVSSGSYRIIFSANETGTDADFDLSSVGTVSSDPSGALTNITFTQSQAASNAVFTIDGVQVTRQSNTINDVVNDVTFNLAATTPALTTLTVNIQPDTELAKGGVINFINAYNALRTFAAKQSELKSDGTTAEGAVLSTNATLRATLNTLSSELSTIVGGISSSPNRLSELGITFADVPATKDAPMVRNILTLDEGKLTSALASDFQAVRNVFGFDATFGDANFRVFSRTNALSANDFTLTVNPGTSTFQAVVDGQTLTLDATELSNSAGYTLKGQAGTALEGLVLIYASTNSTTTSVHLSQGIADRIYNTTDSILADTTGALSIEQQSIKDSDTKLQEDIDRINAQVDRFREELLTKFAALEKAISSVNTLLTSLDAQDKARIAASS